MCTLRRTKFISWFASYDFFQSSRLCGAVCSWTGSVIIGAMSFIAATRAQRWLWVRTRGLSARFSVHKSQNTWRQQRRCRKIVARMKTQSFPVAVWLEQKSRRSKANNWRSLRGAVKAKSFHSLVLYNILFRMSRGTWYTACCRHIRHRFHARCIWNVQNTKVCKTTKIKKNLFFACIVHNF